jgi:predicted ATPase
MTNKLIDEISIRNYKSIKELIKFPLNNINILIGANGSGKSNFLSFFDFVKNSFVKYKDDTQQGGSDSLLFLGRRNSQFLSYSITLSNLDYHFPGGSKFQATEDNKLAWVGYVDTILHDIHYEEYINYDFMKYHPELAIYLYDNAHKDDGYRVSVNEFIEIGLENSIEDFSNNTTQYHFHDTSKLSPILTDCMLNNNDMLLSNGKNIMPFVYRIYQENRQSYSMIVNAIRSCVDDFHDFYIRKNIKSDDMVRLEWQHKHDIGEPKHGILLSDGSLRIICLIVLLLQPIEWIPQLVIIDEPELGMHPKALSLIAALIKQISPQKQFIIATQAPEFINLFTPEDIIVCDKNEDSSSSFKRLNSQELKAWLDDYSVADLWQMNIIGGQK